MARLDREVQEIRNHAPYVEEGLLSRQLRDGRVLRRLKVEFFYGRDWSGWPIHGFMDALDEYIHWHNEEGIKLSLGGMSPMRYRRSLGLGEGKISWTPS